MIPEIVQSHHSECELKKTSVFLLLLLSTVTSGIYFPVWFLTQLKGLNSLRSTEKLNPGVFIFAILMISMAILLPLVSINEYGYVLSLLLQVVFIMLMIDQCIKVRRILEDHHKVAFGKDMDVSKVATVCFQIFYLQYKINRMC